MRSAFLRQLSLVLATVVLVWGTACSSGSQDLDKVVVQTAAGPQTFQVELADEPEERRQGLMFRHDLAPDHGMLFDIGSDQLLHMWMKNTFISLDMLFIAADGRIIKIVENAEPQSERIISSDVPVRGVLEVAGGTAERLEIKVGDRIVHPLFASPGD